MSRIVQDTLAALQDQGITGWKLGCISETATGVQPAEGHLLNKRIAVLLSGRGSNFHRWFAASQSGTSAARSVL